MKKTSLLLLLLFVWTICLGADDKGLKTYKNEKDHYEFAYPANWLLDTDEKANYVSLLSPEAKRPDSFDLLQGIKVEFMPETEPQTFQQRLEAEKFSPCGTTHEGKQTTYCAEIEGIIYLATGLNRGSEFITSWGYIPEPKKKAEYLAKYLQIIDSFYFTAK